MDYELTQVVLTVANLVMTVFIAYYRLSIKELRTTIALLISVAKKEVFDEIEKKDYVCNEDFQRALADRDELMTERLDHRDTLRLALADRVKRLEDGRA